MLQDRWLGVPTLLVVTPTLYLLFVLLLLQSPLSHFLFLFSLCLHRHVFLLLLSHHHLLSISSSFSSSPDSLSFSSSFSLPPPASEGREGLQIIKCGGMTPAVPFANHSGVDCSFSPENYTFISSFRVLLPVGYTHTHISMNMLEIIRRQRGSFTYISGYRRDVLNLLNF